MQKMTVYDFIRKISDIITPETGAFYDYVLYTSDDNGALRTCYCRHSRPLKNFDISDPPEYVLVSAEAPINTDELSNERGSYVKLQITYDYRYPIDEHMKIDANLLYRFHYVFDLEEKEYIMLETVY